MKTVGWTAEVSWWTASDSGSEYGAAPAVALGCRIAVLDPGRPSRRRSCGSGRRRSVRAVQGIAVGRARRPAVLAPVGGGGRAPGAAVAFGSSSSGLVPKRARGDEPVGVHDRDDDHADVWRAVRDPRVARVVALDEVARELHRELARRPLAGVVEAEVEEDGAAVVGAVHVCGDLDALDRPALEGRADRDRADERGVRVASAFISVV